jgi:alpha-1,6-mannosyltransferase
VRNDDLAVDPVAPATAGAPARTAPAGPRWHEARSRRLLRDVVHGTPPGEEVSAHVPAPVVDPHTGPVRRHLLLVASAGAGLTGSLLIVASAPVWRLAAPSWRLTLPGVPHPGSSFFNGAVFLVGVILMTLAWMGLIGRAERQRGSEARRLAIVVAVAALWAVPVVLGPPLLSNDVYSYVAQGELASRGLDPTSHGPIYLGRGDIMKAADPVWRTNPAPYGPVAVQISETAVEVAGHDAAAAVWVWRGIVSAGVAMTAVGVALIARTKGVSPAVAVAIGIANPLVLLHLVGGVHNDAVMLGFLALGLAAHVRGRRWLGIALIAAATAVKLPAGIAFLYIGWTWSSPADGDPGTEPVPLTRRLRDVVMVATGGLGVLVALSLVVGTGPGWVLALQNTGKVTDTFSGTTKLGYVLADGARAIGLPGGESAVVAVTRLAGVAATGALALLLLVRSPRLGVVRAVGLVLVAYVFLGPVVWPWYLTAGLALLAAVGIGRYRPTYFVLVFAATLLVWPTSVEPVVSLNRYQHLLGLGVVLLIAASAWGAQRLADWRHQRRLERHRGAVGAPPHVSPTVPTAPAPVPVDAG